MLKNLTLLAAIIALPFLLRRTDATATWHEGDPILVIVTPHNEAIRYEFEHAFSKWHQAKYGKPVKIDWRVPGGTTEIMRYLASEYASSAKAWWTRTLKNEWPDNGTEAVVASAPPSNPDQLNLYQTFRQTDDPETLSARLDLFFGGGPFDHISAYNQGMTVAPWKTGEEPKALFIDPATGTVLIPQIVSGETWRTSTAYGNVASAFGICYNVDRLRELGVTTPPASWYDLANPVYFGQFGACDPTKSGSVAKAFEMIIQQTMHDTVVQAGFSDKQIAAFETQIEIFSKTKGKTYQRGEIPPTVPPGYQQAVERGWIKGQALIQAIGANARYFTDSAQKVPIDVSVGDAAVGMSIDFYGRYQAQSSNGPRGEVRMVYLTPLGGSSVATDPISLLRGAGGGASTPQERKDRRQIAIRFIEFTLSEAGQKLWTYRPGEPGGPEKFALRRVPVRRDFYPSTNPAIQARHLEHNKHAADDLASPSIDPYQLATQFTYYPRWTAGHFSIQRDLIKVMCIDAGEELKSIYAAAKQKNSKPDSKIFSTMPEVAFLNKMTQQQDKVPLNWRTAPDILNSRKYDRMEILRKWTAFFREHYHQLSTGH